MKGTIPCAQSSPASQAAVSVGGVSTPPSRQGLLVLLGVGPEHGGNSRKMADKVLGLRIFEDENGKMNLNLAAAGAPCSSSRSLPSTPT